VRNSSISRADIAAGASPLVGATLASPGVARGRKPQIAEAAD
jgi:hypothetical protein